MPITDFTTPTETISEARATAAAEERERLGALLHDGVLQSLNVAALELAHLKLELMAAADLGVTYPALPFAEMLQISDALERQMRLAFRDVRGWLRRQSDLPPASFAAGRQPDGDLLGALRWLVVHRLRFVLGESSAAVPATPLDGFSRQSHRFSPIEEVPTVHLRGGGGAIMLAPTTEAEVLAMVQEALLNANRHGHARTILVTIKLATGASQGEDASGDDGESAFVIRPTHRTPPPLAVPILELVVVDDGTNATEAILNKDAVPKDGFGQRAMSARATRLGGALCIAPVPLGGTRVFLQLPLPPHAPGQPFLGSSRSSQDSALGDADALP